MTQIYLIRHAEAEGNLYRRIHGWYDSTVTENGYRQIEALTARFRELPIHAAYSSDLYRTRTTAGDICRSKGLELRLRRDLREFGMGVWEDMPWAEALRRDPQEMGRFNRNDPAFSCQGGETFEGVRRRVSEAVLDIARENPGRTAAVFTHGLAIRNTLGKFMGFTISQVGEQLPHGDNTAVSLLEVEGDQVKVAYYNDNSHLSDEISTFARQRWWRKGDTLADFNLWYRPLDMAAQADFYCQARADAWRTIHGSLCRYDGEGFLREAGEQAAYDPRSVVQAMLGEEPVGLLQLDLRQEVGQGIGSIPFFYLLPAFRRRGLGVQLLGQAVSVCRPLGCARLRLRCAPDNTPAQRFYRKYGFRKVGEEAGARVPLDLLEKYIGY